MPCLVAHQAFSEVTTRHRVQAPWCLLEAISPWLWEQVVGGQMGDYGSPSRGAPRQTNGSPVSASRTPSRLGGRVGSARASFSSSWVSPVTGLLSGFSGRPVGVLGLTSTVPERFASHKSAPDKLAPSNQVLERFECDSIAPDKSASVKTAQDRSAPRRRTPLRWAELNPSLNRLFRSIAIPSLYIPPFPRLVVLRQLK